jgi:hypothetical protein
LNADGAPVNLTDAELTLPGRGAIGPITSHGGYLNVGNSPGLVVVSGAVRLDSASAFKALASNMRKPDRPTPSSARPGPWTSEAPRLILSA